LGFISYIKYQQISTKEKEEEDRFFNGGREN
jgi:hypothetical protein